MQLKESLEQQITTLTNSLQNDPTSEINNIINTISELRNKIELSSKANNVIEKHVSITNKRQSLVEFNEYISDLQTIKKCAIEAECIVLQQIVDSINDSIESVCESLFDKDINISLNLFKTTKTTKTTKPIVNFSISYQGGTFDNINHLSGGEGDRASLALTLALNRLSSCPILMLDESLASLDSIMKDAAIKTIRENSNTTVLVVIHDGIEGNFNHVLDIDESGKYKY